jgi:hypothetical protein
MQEQDAVLAEIIRGVGGIARRSGSKHNSRGLGKDLKGIASIPLTRQCGPQDRQNLRADQRGYELRSGSCDDALADWQ